MVSSDVLELRIRYPSWASRSRPLLVDCLRNDIDHLRQSEIRRRIEARPLNERRAIFVIGMPPPGPLPKARLEGLLLAATFRRKGSSTVPLVSIESEGHRFPSRQLRHSRRHGPVSTGTGTLR